MLGDGIFTANPKIKSKESLLIMPSLHITYLSRQAISVLPLLDIAAPRQHDVTG